jgi:aminoglycoside 2'-N-acetyltransferase I
MTVPEQRVVVLHTADVDAATLEAAHSLLAEVFSDLAPEDWEHCLGGMHALAYEDAELVGHAAVVQRRLIHDGRILRTGYVEGVAVREGFRHRGHAAAMMAEVERIIRAAYELGALGSTDMAQPFYAGRGWQIWRGQTFALTPAGIVRTPDEDDGIFVFPGAVPLELTGELTCDWREGEVW